MCPFLGSYRKRVPSQKKTSVLIIQPDNAQSEKSETVHGSSDRPFSQSVSNNVSNSNRAKLLDSLLARISELFNGVEQENKELREQTELLWEALKKDLDTKNSSATDDTSMSPGELKMMIPDGEKIKKNKKTTTRKGSLRGKTLQEDLNLFWMRRKSFELIGKLYEQYIGSLYERRGYEVKYNGIVAGYEDEGIDLICKKGTSVLLIQCKNWSKKNGKCIREKYIFQLIGTCMAYKKRNPEKKISPVFITTSVLSDVAKKYAKEFHVLIREEFPKKQVKNGNKYAVQVIKCKITDKGEKIFYVPFDDEYFDIKMYLQKGDAYYETVAEAEAAGFHYVHPERYEQKGD